MPMWCVSAAFAAKQKPRAAGRTAESSALRSFPFGWLLLLIRRDRNRRFRPHRPSSFTLLIGCKKAVFYP